MKRILLLLILATCTLDLFSQGELPVNMYTGMPGIFVKLYTLTDHDLSETVSLTYNINALNVNTPKTYGVGWNLDVGGQVFREVRGLPDDFTGTGSDPRRGWLYNNNFSSILNFANSSDLSASTCDEQTDNTFIGNLGDKVDTEPDLFSFSVGGISGHFVFNNNGGISLIPYQDVLITPQYSTDSQTPRKITGWTIQTNSGITYTFNEACAATRSLSRLTNNLTMLNRDYNQYSTDSGLPAVSYNSAWMLTKTTSYTGASLTYLYNSTPAGFSGWKEFSIFSPGTPPSRTTFFHMMEYTTSTIKSVKSISTSFGASAVFTKFDEISFSDPDRPTPKTFKKFEMAYSSGFLTSITESDVTNCTQMPPYKFYYNAQGNYPLNGSTNQDFWGYYNGASNSLTTFTPTIYCYPNLTASDRYRIYPIPSYSGPQVVLQGSGNRMPNADAMLTGALTRIVYPTGGETDLTFEPNTYYDATALKDQLGGGLRIKSAVYYDGVNPTANITKNFTYADTNGHSSGRMITMPIFAVPLWQFSNGTTTISYNTLVSQGLNNQWSGVTAVSQSDLNPTETTSGSSVGYARVTVTRPNNGKAVFEYLVPAAYGDLATGGGSTDWKPTVMKFARPTFPFCPSMDQITSAETWGYPAFANPYYDYERGLLNTKTEYNNANTPVRITQQNYQYIYKAGTQPTSIVGLAYDLFANSSVSTYLYGRYSLIADVAKVVSTETVVTYDENNASQFSTETTQYSFNSPFHKLVSQISKTAPDGTVRRTSLKYTLDYPVSTQPIDVPLSMIWQLKNMNRNSTVIEQVNTVQPAGGTVKTASASLVMFDPFATSPAKPLLRYQLTFRPDAPVTDFDPSRVDDVDYTFHNDSRYQVVNTINEYDSYEMPLSSTDENGNTRATLWGYNNRLPAASFGQAQFGNVGFSDFETTTASSFALSNFYYGQGRTGTRAVHPIVILTRDIAKPATATVYTLSYWLMNQANTSVTIRVTVKDGQGNTLYTNDQVCTLTSNDYQYFTRSIDVSSFPSNFTVQVQGVGFTQSGTLPMLDDVGFYPDYVALTSTTYDLPFGANAVTDPSGMTMFTSYDGLGRVKLVTDQDHNIRKRISYAATGQILPTTITAAIDSIQGKYETNTAINFVAVANNCITGVTYEWNFGSGFSAPSSSNISPAQTYTAIGNHSLTLRVTHSIYGQKTTTFFYTINPPLSVTICPSGVKEMDAMMVTQTYTCFTNPNPSNWFTFKVTQTAGDASGWTYQWKEHRICMTDWVNVPNNSTNMYGRQVLWREGSFEVSCTVTTSDGRTATSSPVLVTVTQTQ